MKIFGYEDFMDNFLGSSQNWTSFRGHFYAFYGLSLRSGYRMGIFFGGCLYFKYIFGGMPDVPDIFLGVNSRRWVKAYVWVELRFSLNMSNET